MSNFSCSTASATQKNCISIDLDLCLFNVLFAMPTAVELSQCIGISGWGWPISLSVSQTIVACLHLINNAPSLASAADATRNLNIAHTVKCPVQFGRHCGIGFPSHEEVTARSGCCGHLLQISMMHPNEFLTPCLTREIARLPPSELLSSQGVALFFVLYFLCCGLAHWLSC